MKYESPLARELITNIRKLLESRNIPLISLTPYLNEFLENGRKLETDSSSDRYESDRKQLYRWMNPDHEDWSPPQGEMMLAFQKTYEKLSIIS